MNCFYKDLQPGTAVTLGTTELRCTRCDSPVVFTDKAAHYLGHDFDGRDREKCDWFSLVDKILCENCGAVIKDVYIICDSCEETAEEKEDSKSLLS